MTISMRATGLRALLRRPVLLARLRRLETLERKAAAPIVYGNQVEVHASGEDAFARMIADLARAGRSIAIEMYTWADDRTGRRFAEAAAERARAGVPVRVLLDAFGSLGSSRIAATLEAAGAEVLWYHPLAPWTPHWFPNRRNHRKVVVVDGRIAFLGGMNFADAYTAEFAGGNAWRDLAVRIEGPAARELVRGFVGSWARAGGALDAAGDLASSAAERGKAGVQVVGRLGLRGRRALRRAHLALILGAQDHVFVANAYFAPERAMQRALMRAARRGVRVDLLLPSRSDVPIVRWAGRASYEPLLAAGVRIREHRGAVLHAKVAVFDGRVLLTGSANLDYRSFRHNLEIAGTVLDHDAATRALGCFERDWESGEPVDLASWRRRRWTDRIRESAARLFVRWL